MDWIVGLLLLVAGVVVGFFLAKYRLDNKQTVTETQVTEQTIKEIMAQQAAAHIGQSRMLVETMQRECEKLVEQMDAYENLLESAQVDENGNRLNFYGEHATMYIQNQQKKSKRKPTSTEFQPKDFSSGSSGLFSGAENDQVVDEKQS